MTERQILMQSIQQAQANAYWMGRAGVPMMGSVLAHCSLCESSIAAGVNTRNVFWDNYQMGLAERAEIEAKNGN